MGVPDTEKIRRHLNALHALLRQHGADATRHVLDQLKSLPKYTLFRLSHEAISRGISQIRRENWPRSNFGSMDVFFEHETRALFDVVPSKATALSGLSWFEFE